MVFRVTDARLTSYESVWCIHTILQLYQQYFLFPSCWSSLCGTAIAIAVASGLNRNGMTLAITVRNMARMDAMPFLWDSEYWCMLTDAALLVSLWQKNPSTGMTRFRQTVRLQWAILYFAAGIWKLNRGFLSPTTSCASIFSAQIITPLPAWPVVLLEMGIGAAWFLGHDQLGVWLCLAFHAAVALTPKPNGVPTFSLIAATRCVAFVDLRWHPGAAVAAILVGSWTRDPAAALFAALSVCICTSPVLRRSGSSYRVLWVATIIYASLPMWGLMDIGAPTMFGNLKVHGGSNHFFLPTGLLQTWLYESESAFGGGVVRVEGTTSSFINSLYPGELSLEASVVSSLQGAGHLGREFNPKARRVVGTPARRPSPFSPYTIPLLELRRLLHEAPRPFNITYSYLSGIVGDENWRRGPPLYTISLSLVDNNDGDKFGPVVKILNSTKVDMMRPAMVQDMLALKPPPSWALKLMLFASSAVDPSTSGDSVPCNY